MSPSRSRYYRGLYGVAAVYDTVLGLAFLFFSRPLFESLGAEDTLPEHGAFMSLIAAFLFVIGVAYAFIAFGDLRKNIDLIAVGALYKLAYTSVAAYYFAIGDYPHLVFIAVFGLADLAFLILMAESWWYLRHTPEIEARHVRERVFAGH